MVDKLTIKAKSKEIDLIVNIINKIYSLKDWAFLHFGSQDTGIMIPPGYFDKAEMSREFDVEE